MRNHSEDGDLIQLGHNNPSLAIHANASREIHLPMPQRPHQPPLMEHLNPIAPSDPNIVIGIHKQEARPTLFHCLDEVSLGIKELDPTVTKISHDDLAISQESNLGREVELAIATPR